MPARDGCRPRQSHYRAPSTMPGSPPPRRRGAPAERTSATADLNHEGSILPPAGADAHPSPNRTSPPRTSAPIGWRTGVTDLATTSRRGFSGAARSPLDTPPTREKGPRAVSFGESRRSAASCGGREIPRSSAGCSSRLWGRSVRRCLLARTADQGPPVFKFASASTTCAAHAQLRSSACCTRAGRPPDVATARGAARDPRSSRSDSVSWGA